MNGGPSARSKLLSKLCCAKPPAFMLSQGISGYLWPEPAAEKEHDEDGSDGGEGGGTQIQL